MANQWGRLNSEMQLRITDEGVSYRDSQVSCEEKWSYFTSYQADKKFIVLIHISPFAGDFISRNDELSEAELAELMAFIRPLH